MKSNSIITLTSSMRQIVTSTKIFISCFLLVSASVSVEAVAQSEHSASDQQQTKEIPLHGIELISVDAAFSRAVLKSNRTGIVLVAKGQLFPASTIRINRVFNDKIEFEVVSAGENPEKLKGYLYKSVNGKSELSWITVKAPLPLEFSRITTVDTPDSTFTKK